MTQEEADGEAMLEQGLRMKLERLAGDKTMTEPSDAAKRKARDLMGNPLGALFSVAATERILARVLQDHSSAAKDGIDTFETLSSRGLVPTPIDWRWLESLVLPDEPQDDLTVVEGYQLQPDGTRARVRVALRDMRIVEAGND